MWNVHPQSVTHCQRRLAAKFQFVFLPSEGEKTAMAQKRFRDTLLLLASTLAALCLFLSPSTKVVLLLCAIFFLVLLSALVEKPSESRPFRPAAAGLAAMEENEYYLQNARTIIATRDRTADARLQGRRK